LLELPEESCTKFRQLAYYCNFLTRTQREFVSADATMDRLEELWEWHQTEADIVARQDLTVPETIKNERHASA
jgi:hypothetical protein